MTIPIPIRPSRPLAVVRKVASPSTKLFVGVDGDDVNLASSGTERELESPLETLTLGW